MCIRPLQSVGACASHAARVASRLTHSRRPFFKSKRGACPRALSIRATQLIPRATCQHLRVRLAHGARCIGSSRTTRLGDVVLPLRVFPQPSASHPRAQFRRAGCDPKRGSQSSAASRLRCRLQPRNIWSLRDLGAVDRRAALRRLSGRQRRKCSPGTPRGQVSRTGEAVPHH